MRDHRARRRTRQALRRAACGSAWLWGSLNAGCNLVGYDELKEPARALDVDSSAAVGVDPTDAAALDGKVDLNMDAASHVPLDAGSDGARIDAGWWTGKVPDMTCSDGQKCYPTCQPAMNACVFDCAGASECQNSCLHGTACEVACEHADTCYMACKEDGQCWLDCQSSSQCEAWCTKGTHCQVDCADSQSCRATCLDGSSCEIDCRGGADCSAVSCTTGAACLMRCGPAGCDFHCDGSGASCADNIEVCNRACP